MGKEGGVFTFTRALSRQNSSHKSPPVRAPNSTKQAGAKEKEPTVHWKTVFYIVGPFLSAVAFFIGHYLLFNSLDKRTVDGFPIGQSIVTTVSLLLITAFRLSVVASVGLCFTQHLWHVLRMTALPVFRIEQIFRIRSNPLLLTNPKVLWATPLLFSMAMYLCFIELAAVYPPGALNVVPQAQAILRDRNMTVINQNITHTIVPWEENGTYPVLSELYVQTWDNFDDSYISQGRYIGYGYLTPLRSLAALSKYVMSAGNIVDLPSPEQNMSYSLQFRAPQLSCSETIFNSTIALGSVYKTTVFNSTWSVNKTDGNATYILNQRRYFGWYYEINGSDTSSNYLEIMGTNQTTTTFIAAETRTMACEPRSVLYNLSITYLKGIQQVNYSMSDYQPLTFLDGGTFSAMESNNTSGHDTWGRTPTIWGADFSEWPEKLKERLDAWNVFAPLDAMLINMECKWTILSDLLYETNTGVEWATKNGTKLRLAALGPETDNFQDIRSKPDTTLLQDSVFDTQRFNNTQLNVINAAEDVEYKNPFDPRNLLINENSLNALLSNITISALSLGVQYAMVPVTITDYRNTYEFSNRINFFLPYALCLGFALIYVIIGIRALYLNVVPATDGGFLQIMMATRGRTEMEELVLKEGIIGTGELSKELLNMKIRFGELADTELVPGPGGSVRERRTVTFGTTDETLPLKRRGINA